MFSIAVDLTRPEKTLRYFQLRLPPSENNSLTSIVMLSSHLVLWNGCFSRYISFVHHGLTSVYHYPHFFRSSVYLSGLFNLLFPSQTWILFTSVSWLLACTVSSKQLIVIHVNKKWNILVPKHSSLQAFSMNLVLHIIIIYFFGSV